MLETVAAAPRVHEFGRDRSGCEHDRMTEEHVEILERDRRRVVPRNGVQRLERGRARAGVTDAGEVGVEFEAGGQ